MAIGNIGQKIRTDPNLSRAVSGIVRGAKGLPAGTGRYLLAKIPLARWLPNYSPLWIIDDVIAGLSVGALLVPQALIYSTLAGVPLKDGLLASWLPGLIYAVMGTSKGTY
jgi:sodium-independent sulfate anion transporter 11